MKTHTITYGKVNVDGINIFYREAGDKTRPQLILLNGIPNASGAFQDLMNALKEDYYLLAPDFPGFGNSDAPGINDYEYSFNNISLTIERFMEIMELKKPNVYALGYGGPVTFRITTRRPGIFNHYILQNTNAYEEGLGPAMHGAAPFLNNRNKETENLVKPLLTLDGIKLFFLDGAKYPGKINPDHYNNALHYLTRPGQEEIQLELLYNYAHNIAEYPNWQKWLKETQPRLLLVWGKNDPFFPLSAAEAIKKDVPSATLHAYDTSHLALEEHHTDIAENIKSFIG